MEWYIIRMLFACNLFLDRTRGERPTKPRSHLFMTGYFTFWFLVARFFPKKLIARFLLRDGEWLFRRFL